MLADLLVGQALTVLLVFSRLGAALMLVPGFGEHHVPPRLRLLLGLLLGVLVAPAVATSMPLLPREPLALAGLVGRELLTGLLLGFVARLALAAIHAGGALIAMQSGLSAAAMFDPAEAGQGTIPASFLAAAALTVLFAGGFHHLLLRALTASYATFPLGGGVDLARAAELLVGLCAEALATGVRIAAPLVLAGLLANLGLGAIGRLVPSFPVFFLALPVQILLALAVLKLALPAAMTLFADALVDGVGWLDQGG